MTDEQLIGMAKARGLHDEETALAFGRAVAAQVTNPVFWQKPDLKLVELLEKAKSHVMTPEEVFEQRVSFIYGMQDFDGPEITKEQIRRVLRAL